MSDSAKTINAVFNVLTDKVMTLDDIERLNPCSRHEIIKVMSRLISRGAVERLENGVYRLTDFGESLKTNGNLKIFHSGPYGQYNRNKRSSDTLRNRIWRLILLNRKVTINELVGLAIDGAEKDPTNNIRKYLRALVKSGYLREMPRRLKGDVPGSNGFKQYMLIKDSGHLAPVMRSDKKEVYDPNTGEVVTWQV